MKMNKLTATIFTVATIATCSPVNAQAVSMPQNVVTKVNAIAKAEHLPVKVVSQKKLTMKKLTHRKDKYILVEECVGRVTTKRKDGKVINPRCKGYDYISYRGTKNVKKGDKVLTYFIYNPSNNYEDDILYRFDKKIKEGK